MYVEAWHCSYGCPRISYGVSRNDSKDLEVEKTTTDEDVNEEGDDFKSKEHIEVHDS